MKDRLVSILQKWENYCEGVVPHFTEVNLENFCIRVSPIVIPEELTELSPLLIVAEDSYSHVCYREKLKLWLSSECVSIDDRLYYSLEEIPSYYFNRDCIIVCEKSLLNLKVPIGKGTIFPIANNSILDDIKSIIVSIYEKKRNQTILKLVGDDMKYGRLTILSYGKKGNQKRLFAYAIVERQRKFIYQT